MRGVFWAGGIGVGGWEMKRRVVGVRGFLTGKIRLFGMDYNKSVIFAVSGRMWRG
jgi:hypothetical protein